MLRISNEFKAKKLGVNDGDGSIESNSTLL